MHTCLDRGVPCRACFTGNDAAYLVAWRQWEQKNAGCGVCGSESCERSRSKDRWGLRTCLACGALENVSGWTATAAK